MSEESTDITTELSVEAKAIEAAILAKGEEIKALKAIKPPPLTIKEDLAPLVQQLLSLKLQFKEHTGAEYGAGSSSTTENSKKKKEAVPQVEKEKEGPSKTELNKLKRKEQKAAKKAEEREATGAPAPIVSVSAKASSNQEGGDIPEENTSLFGDAPLIRSEFMTEKIYVKIKDLSPTMVGQGQRVWIRARLATSRAVGKGVFVLLRQMVYSVQGVLFQGKEVSKNMVKYTSGISLESVVDVEVSVTVPDAPIQSATVRNLELNIHEIHVISRAMELPFLVEDAGR
eukprot:gene25609-33440_t